MSDTPGMPPFARRMRAEHVADRIVLTCGLLLSIVGAGWLLALVVNKADGFRGWSCGVYGGALVLMYLCATLYHWIPDHRPRSLLRIVDHCAIYVLIAGTYTPFTLPNFSAAWARTTLLLMWLMVAAGIIFKFVWIGRTERFSLLLYLAMGWSALAVFQPLSASVSPAVFQLIVAGGLLYSLGAVIYACKALPFRLPVWHLFVIAGSAVHFVAVAFYLMA